MANNKRPGGRPRPGFVIDIDGVIVRGARLIGGAKSFVQGLKRGQFPFVFLTNNSEETPRQLQRKFAKVGVHVGLDHFFTAAMATAKFLHSQKPGARVFVLGGRGLRDTLKGVGLVLTEKQPDYVVVGNPKEYTFLKLKKAIHLVRHGARLIGTNPDLTGPVEDGIIPACGSLIAPIELSTKKNPYFVGKPNPLMMRMALRFLNVRSSNAFMVGDRMDTDIQAGLEAGMRALLVLSGVTRRKSIKRFAFKPHRVFRHVGEIPLKGWVP